MPLGTFPSSSKNQKKEYNSMITKESEKKNYIDVPIYNLRMLTDEDWNRLVYVNWMGRQSIKNSQITKDDLDNGFR